MYEIIIVEDDINFATQLKQLLERFNYSASIINDFENVATTILNNKYSLVLMDVNLNYHDGFFWTKKIREKSNVPIIFISARDKALEQVMALSYGADDYIVKPVDMDLLLMKIQAILRRVYDYRESDNAKHIECGEYHLDLNKLELEYKDKRIELTKNEFKILQKLMIHAKEYVSREELMDYLWESESFIDDNAFNVNLSRLRKKIIALAKQDVIKTKRLVGYKFSYEKY